MCCAHNVVNMVRGMVKWGPAVFVHNRGQSALVVCRSDALPSAPCVMCRRMCGKYRDIFGFRPTCCVLFYLIRYTYDMRPPSCNHNNSGDLQTFPNHARPSPSLTSINTTSSDRRDCAVEDAGVGIGVKGTCVYRIATITGCLFRAVGEVFVYLPTVSVKQ